MTIKSDRKPILVTGSHRSGSTWAGKILSTAPNVAYLHEPFGLNHRISINPVTFDHWFQYICEENAGDYATIIEQILHYQYPFLVNLPKIRSVRNIAKLLLDQCRSAYHAHNNNQAIIKDPIAFYSAEWLSQVFAMHVLILIRHPAAFCSSLKIKNWTFDFTHFLNQPLLMEKYLLPFKEEMIDCVSKQKGIIEQAILLWNCFHHTVLIYKKKHPEWYFIKHEDLSRNPVSEFKAIFKVFDLEFNQITENAILKSSGAHNPVEQLKGNEFIRNSKENINNWQSRLSIEEIQLIKRKTKHIAGKFYQEHEW